MWRSAGLKMLCQHGVGAISVLPRLGFFSDPGLCSRSAFIIHVTGAVWGMAGGQLRRSAWTRREWQPVFCLFGRLWLECAHLIDPVEKWQVYNEYAKQM